MIAKQFHSFRGLARGKRYFVLMTLAEQDDCLGPNGFEGEYDRSAAVLPDNSPALGVRLAVDQCNAPTTVADADHRGHQR